MTIEQPSIADESKMTDQIGIATRTTKRLAKTVVDNTRDQFARAAEAPAKTADDATAFGKSNVEAFLHVGSIVFQGLEELSRNMLGMTQSHLESSIGAAKSLMAAKTMTEFTDLQSAYGKAAFDNAVSDAARISELALKITNEAIEPIAQRVTATFEQIAKPVFAPAA